MKIKLTAEMRMRLAYAEEIADIVAPIIAERDALAATVEALRKALIGAVNTLTYENSEGERCVSFIECADISEEVKPYLDAIGATPQQHLAELRAEDGRAGFIAGYFYYRSYGFQFEEELEAASNKYADSVRMGE